jgi:Mn-dependent DtxR family transcriptional regulator
MPRKAPPPPSKSAERLLGYLEIVESAQAQRGYAKRYDLFKKAMNTAYTSYVISYLKDAGFIKGDDEGGYRMTKEGEFCLEMLKKHRDLVGAFTRELAGDRIKRWDS